MHVAAIAGHVKAINLLIANGADVEARDNFYETALHNAASSGHNEVIKLLLQHVSGR